MWPDSVNSVNHQSSLPFEEILNVFQIFSACIFSRWFCSIAGQHWWLDIHKYMAVISNGTEAAGTQKKPSVVKDIIESNVHTKPNECEVSSCDPLKCGTDRLNVTSGFPAETLQLDSFSTLRVEFRGSN